MDDAAPPRPTTAREGLWAVAGRVVPALAVLTVLTQVAYPLLDGGRLRTATVLAVLAFAATSVLHVATTLGPGAAARLLVVAAGTGLLAEAVGVRTGVPFGDYSYAGTLGPRLLGVPVVVPLAWTMMAWPALVLGRRLARGRRRRRPAVALLGGATLAAWDLYLDPQMVDAGHWRWTDPTPALPGVPGIPLTNYAGWLLVAVVMVAALDAALPDAPMTRAAHAVPAGLLAWTWLGSGLAAAAFFGRPATAAWGLLVMGAVVAPYLWSLTAPPPRAQRAAVPVRAGVR